MSTARKGAAPVGAFVLALAVAGSCSGAGHGRRAPPASIVGAPSAPNAAATPTVAPTPADNAGVLAYVCFGAGGATCLVGAGGSNPHPSASGSQVAFAARGGLAVEVFDANGNRSADGEVQVGPPSGQAYRTVATFQGMAASFPAVSPDGTRVAFMVRNQPYAPPAGQIRPGLYVVATGGGHPHLVVTNALGPVTWDPSGTKVAYLALNGPDPTQPSSVSVDSIAASGGRADQVSVVWDRAKDLPDAAPADTWAWLSWSPDGATILYSDLSGQLAEPGFNRVEAIPVAGGSATTLLEGSWSPSTSIYYQDANYSPDGSRFAVLVTCSAATSFGNPNVSYRELELANPDGSHLTPVIDPTSPDPCATRTAAALKAAADHATASNPLPSYLLGWVRWTPNFNTGVTAP